MQLQTGATADVGKAMRKGPQWYQGDIGSMEGVSHCEFVSEACLRNWGDLLSCVKENFDLIYVCGAIFSYTN